MKTYLFIFFTMIINTNSRKIRRLPNGKKNKKLRGIQFAKKRIASGNIGDGSCADRACDHASGNIGDGSCTHHASCIGSNSNIGDGSCTGDLGCFESVGTIGDSSCTTTRACFGYQGDIPSNCPSVAHMQASRCSTYPCPPYPDSCVNGLTCANDGNCRMVRRGKACNKQSKNLGTGFSTPEECMVAARSDSSCTGNEIMWSDSYSSHWGCRCCSKIRCPTWYSDYYSNRNWDTYEYRNCQVYIATVNQVCLTNPLDGCPLCTGRCAEGLHCIRNPGTLWGYTIYTCQPQLYYVPP